MNTMNLNTDDVQTPSLSVVFAVHSEAQDGSTLLDRLQVGVAWAFFGAVLAGFGVAIYGGHPQVESIQAVSALAAVVLARSLNYF